MTHDDIYRIVRAANLGRTVRMAELEDGNFNSHDSLIPTDRDEYYAFLVGSTDYDIEYAVRTGSTRVPHPDWLVLE
jgi:hypothetical protein